MSEIHLAARDLVYLTEIRETWSRPERLGRDDRDLRDFVETMEAWPRQGESPRSA